MKSTLTDAADKHGFEIRLRYVKNFEGIRMWRASVPRSSQIEWGETPKEAMDRLELRLKKQGLRRVDLGGEPEETVMP